MKTHLRSPLAVLVALASFALGCGYSASSQGPGPGGTPPGGTPPQQGTAVTVNDDYFSPANLAVSAGQTVTWTWAGQMSHNVTFDDASVGNSPTQSSGTFEKMFATAGSYAYHCTIHGQAMSGTVTVQ